jgi:hypothetical protein
VVIAARSSALAVAVALVIVDGLATLLAFTVTSRAIGVSLREVGRAFAPSLIASAAMSAVLAVWMRWGPEMPLIPGVVVAVTLGAVTYLAALRVSDPGILNEALRMFFARKAAKAQ